MTLTENGAFSGHAEDEQQCIEKMLVQALTDGKVDRRLILGILNSAHILETNPDSVWVCITPQDRYDDVTLRIYYTLIEAFCFENDVPLIKVDKCDKLLHILHGCKIESECGTPLPETRPLQEDDAYCILIQMPDNRPSDNDQELAEMLNDYHQFGCPVPTVKLPG